MEHSIGYSDSTCPVCGPLIESARAASAEWTLQQIHKRRGSAAYQAALAATRAASAALLTAKREHHAARPALPMDYPGWVDRMREAESD